MKNQLHISKIRPAGYHSLVVTVPRAIVEKWDLRKGDYLAFTVSTNEKEIIVRKVE